VQNATQKSHHVHLPPPDITKWAASTTGVPYVHELDSGLSGPEVLVTALVHGNEYSGAWVLDAILKIGFRPKRGRITLAFCNVRAFATFDKAEPDKSRYIDEDFNRAWSVDRLAGAAMTAELERARELLPFVERATHLLDLHSMHEPCEPLFVAGMLPRNTDFAQRMRTSAQVVIDVGHADGVRMRDYGQFGHADGSAVALLLEAGQHWQPSSRLAARNAFMRFLITCAAADAADIPPDWLSPDAEVKPPLFVTHRVVAKTMDFNFVADYQGGEVIEKQGSLIATDGGESILSPYDHCVLVMPSVRQLRPGVTTVRLANRTSPSYNQSN
jgi:predicted deacylase